MKKKDLHSPYAPRRFHRSSSVLNTQAFGPKINNEIAECWLFSWIENCMHVSIEFSDLVLPVEHFWCCLFQSIHRNCVEPNTFVGPVS